MVEKSNSQSQTNIAKGTKPETPNTFSKNSYLFSKQTTITENKLFS